MQRFHRRRSGLEGIGIEPAAARLNDGALQNILRAAAPNVQFDAVFGLECLTERADVFDRFGGVDIDRSLLSRPGEELCNAVGTAVGGNSASVAFVPWAKADVAANNPHSKANAAARPDKARSLGCAST